MRKACVILLCALVWVGTAHAQGVTTGSLGGVVVDPNGEPLPGATVLAVLESTGTRYAGFTDGEGRFRIANVKVGSPYRVEVSLSGFQTAELSNVAVRLGEESYLTFTLQLEAATGEIVVVGEANPLINPTRAGAASSVSQASLEALPTVERSLFDFARSNPLFTTQGADGDGQTVLTVAGRNNRYNNISIDGAVNNDVFGLAGTGTPGGQAETQPIALDAVQELQLVTSTYDVRQGGFTGGSVNAVTRSGSNRWSGAVYGFYSDNDFVGDGPDDFPVLGTFEESQWGVSLGGPIAKDKAFFFVNYENWENDQPTGWSIDGSTGQAWQGGAFTTEAQEFSQFLQSTYGYDTGGLGEVTSSRPSDKLFARLDFNLNASNNLTIRHNYVDAANVRLFPDNEEYWFPNHAYDFANETNSTVAQWNAVWGDSYFNEMRLTYQTISDNRAGVGQDFPFIEILNVDGDFNQWQVGTEPFSTFNSLDQDIIEFTNDFTFFAGDHEIVIGTHNEFYSFKNQFIQDGFGSYEFDTLEDFYAGVASRYDHTYPAPGTSPYDEFDTYQLGFYVGDTWRLAPNMTLIGGLRVDIPFFPDTPDYNPLVESTYGVRTDAIPDGNVLWSPRIGFNWDLDGDGTKQLRGGAGLFSGRTPFVWVSNNYGRTGTRQVTIRAFGDIPFNPDPYDQPTDIGGASTQEVNAIDPDFEFPQTWRFNLAYDHLLPWWDLVASAEMLYAKSVNEIDYKNLNLEPTGELLPFDGRPVYRQASSDFSGAYYLTNTNMGDATNVILKVEKPYGESPLWGFVSYAWGEANVVNDGTSSRAVSNWQYNEAPDPNNASLSTSDFEVEHRATVAVNWEFNRDSRWSTVVSAFWNHQSGRPYTNIYAFNFPSINQDTFAFNDPIYVPSGPDDVIITNGTWDQLYSYLQRVDLDGSLGTIAGRNVSKTPYTTQVDLAFRQSIPVPGNSALQITFDIFNFWNLIDEDSGHVQYVPFGTLSPISYLGVDGATGKPIYELRSIVTNSDSDIFSTDYLRSRWRMKLGVRWSF